MLSEDIVETKKPFEAHLSRQTTLETAWIVAVLVNVVKILERMDNQLYRLEFRVGKLEY